MNGSSRKGRNFSSFRGIAHEAPEPHHVKTCLHIFVIFIPKEGLMDGPAHLLGGWPPPLK